MFHCDSVYIGSSSLLFEESSIFLEPVLKPGSRNQENQEPGQITGTRSVTFKSAQVQIFRLTGDNSLKNQNIPWKIDSIRWQ